MPTQTLRSRRQGALSRRMRNVNEWETKRVEAEAEPDPEKRVARLAGIQRKLDIAKADVRALQGKLS